jgi:hypothetical protein
MAEPRKAGNFTLKDTLEYFVDRYDFSEVLERLQQIAIDKKHRTEDPIKQKELDDLVNLLEQSVDQALAVESEAIR